MLPVLTPSEMAAVDASAPAPVSVLIDRAGAAVAREALRLLGGAYGRRVVVLAGKGNNGADGRAAAVRLRRRGVRVQEIDALDAPATLPPCDLVIDAAYGTGFSGCYDAPDAGGAPVLAVDIPSGVDGVTGQPAGRVLAAARTVTFAALKPGLLLEPGRSLAGQVVLADIGLDVSHTTIGVVEAADVAGWVPVRATTSHKWKAAVLVIAGSSGMAGAARLAARAAQRAGAGMVRVGSPGIADDRSRPARGHRPRAARRRLGGLGARRGRAVRRDRGRPRARPLRSGPGRRATRASPRSGFPWWWTATGWPPSASTHLRSSRPAAPDRAVPPRRVGPAPRPGPTLRRRQPC